MRRGSIRFASLLTTTLLLGPATLAAPTLLVSPSTLDSEDATEVAIDVSGLAGSAVTLRLYTDADGDGTIDAEDYPVWTDVIEDGLVEWAPSMASDLDPTAGAISVDLRQFGPLEFPYSAGDFIWEAEDAFDASSDTAVFSVTHDPGAQSVSGVVTDSLSAQPLPGALVMLEPFCDSGAEALRFYSAFTDENGAYSIQVPADLDCHHRLLVAVKPGYLTGFLGQPHLIFDGSNHFISQDVALDPGTYGVTGQVVYETGPRLGQGVPGLTLFVELEDGPPYLSIAFSDENGDFAFTLDDGSWEMESPEEGLEIRGAVGIAGDGLAFDVDGGSEVLPDVELTAANAFFSGTLSDDSGVPLAGHWVSAYQAWPCSPDCYGGEALTRADGSYVMGVVAPASPATYEYSLNVADPLDGLIAENLGCQTISESETVADADLQHLAPTAYVEGRLSDKNGSGLENVCVQAWGSSAGCNSYSATAVASCDGSYAMPALDGQWNLRLRVGDLAAVYRDLDETEVERQLTVSGSDVGDVNFIVGSWHETPTVTSLSPSVGLAGSHLMIEGHGFSFGSIPEVEFDGLPGLVLEFRPELGALIVEVPAALPEGDHLVTVRNPDLGKTSEPACFATGGGSYTATCTVSGSVSAFGLLGPIEGATIVVFEDGDDGFLRADVSDATGAWTVGLEPALSYSVAFVPPAGQPWIWGQYQVACDSTQNHEFVTGSLLTGRVTSAYGDGLSHALVEAEQIGGSGAYAFAATNEDGIFTLVVPDGDFDVFVDPPTGSRYVAPAALQPTVSGDTDLGQIALSQGYYFCGSVLDVTGDGLRAEVEAYRKENGNWSGFADTRSCSGQFDLTLTAGEYRLEILSDDLETDGPTEVKHIDVQGDSVGQFGFVVYDRHALQWTGSDPRIAFVEPEARGMVGQALQLTGENVSGTTVDVMFTDGGGGLIAGTDTGWDADRGLVVTRVPATAVSGPMLLRVDGVDSRSVPFALDPGTLPTGLYDVSGKVTGPSGDIDGAFVALFWLDPAGADCDEDDGVLFDYARSDSSGSYGTLTHPGGDFQLFVLPPTASGLAPGGDEGLAVFAPMSIDVDLVAGIAVHLRVTDDEAAPGAVPNALIEGGGDDAWDFRLTDAGGDATLYLLPGDLEFELIPPTGSRLLEQQWSDTLLVAHDYGDRAMTRGVMVGSGVVREDDGSGLAGALVEGRQDGAPYDFFFESLTDQDGAFRGPVADAALFQLEVEAPDDLADAREFGLSPGSNDCIFYPALELGAAGLIEGFVRDASSLSALEDIEMNSQEDDLGQPGDFSGWSRTCPDGSYRMKLEAGSHFLRANNGWSGNGYVEKWYPSAYCDQGASSVVVTAGGTTNVDFDLDQAGSISGDVQVNLAPVESAGVCATSASLGCQFCNAQSDPGGNYSLAVPESLDYQVSSWASGVGMQCFDGSDGCSEFDPVGVTAGADSNGVDFRFGCSSGSERFMDQLESGAPGWTTSGMWHLGTDPLCSPSSKSGSTAFHYASGSCDYDTGGANFGTLTSPEISSAPDGLSLTYWQRRETDGNCFVTDRSQVRLWVNGAGPTEIWEECDNANEWTMRLFDLTPYYSPGDDLQVEFEFDSVDGSGNQYAGWMIDDVRLFACDPEVPDEPSGASGLAPLRMTGAGSSSLVVERVDGATAYNVYVDALGSYYAPSLAGGTACTLTSWTDNGDGTITLDVTPPPNSWVVVSASNVSGESGVGSDSAGTDRRTVGSWESCALGPPAGGASAHLPEPPAAGASDEAQPVGRTATRTPGGRR